MKLEELRCCYIDEETGVSCDRMPTQLITFPNDPKGYTCESFTHACEEHAQHFMECDGGGISSPVADMCDSL